jgi:hypothetical protein
MALTFDRAQKQIDRIFGSYQAAVGSSRRSLLPPTLTAGKIYEAWVLCRVLEHLSQQERYTVTLRESSKICLKSAGGPINRAYAHFQLDRAGSRSLEVWTDVTFLTLSASHRHVVSKSAERCDYHELDVVVVPSGTQGRPTIKDICIGVECKNLSYEKEMLRALLGVRRELSLLSGPEPTGFRSWPRRTVPADPPSCLLAYGTDRQILDFAPPGQTFGIDFFYEPLP